MTVRLDVKGLTKRYGNRTVVRDIGFSAASGEVIGIVGNNGSGKSTLVKMIASVLRPSAGTLTLEIDGRLLDPSEVARHCGMVAPYLQIYDEFTPVELLQLHAKLHGTSLEHSQIEQILSTVGLHDAAGRAVRKFSSGMRQRACMALAVSLSPPLLLLDEPGVTLDEAGRLALASCITTARNLGSIVIIATNDEREKGLCDRVVQM